MSRKMKVLVSALVLVLLITVGGTAVALADEEEEPVNASPVETNGVLSRVAEILNIPEEDLTEAFRQAREETREARREEAFNEALEKAVAEGLLSEEEAGEIREWWTQRPEALEQGLWQRACGLLGPRIRNMQGEGCGQGEMNQQRWQGSRANSSDQLPLRARVSKAARGRQMTAVSQG
ncbi:hypothetical protein ACFLXG_01370 [Chloroflexota bacterium]